MPRKRPHDIEAMLARIREAVRPYPKAALFELRDEGWDRVFHQLVACIVSIRTRDEQTLPIARALFEAAPTARAMAALGQEGIDALMPDSAFHEAKARQIYAIALATATEYDGELPCDFEVLTAFAGVGPKCASLALGIACGEARIGV